jgi:general secretion pathway protein G
VKFRKKSGATIMLTTMKKKFASFLRGNRLRLPARSRNDAGYTLLELLVVMGILAVLTAMATPQLMGYFGKAKTQSVQLQIESIGTALELYYMENGSYPSTSVGLKALVEATPEAPRWNGPYLKKAKNLLDPWGRPYQYVYPVSNGDYEVYSLGPNGKGTSASAQERFARGAGRAS